MISFICNDICYTVDLLNRSYFVVDADCCPAVNLRFNISKSQLDDLISALFFGSFARNS